MIQLTIHDFSEETILTLKINWHVGIHTVYV